MRFFVNTNYPFLEWRTRAYVLTAVALLLGIGSMVYNGMQGRGWVNYGVDFTGGTVVQVGFTRPVTSAEVRQAAASQGGADWEISSFGTGGNSYLVRLPASAYSQETGRDAQTVVAGALSGTFKQGTDFRIQRTEAVGPKAGRELQWRALMAILLSFGATLIYLAARFEWRFGLAAIAATAHDILITLGFLAVTRTEISLATVAAVLTVVGYSLHDTIVVFDRVREDLGRPRHGLPFIQILDKAINETLPRTVLTATTVIATLIALLLFAGPVIRPFAIVLFLGIVVGTFSSIFVASPVLYEIERRWPRKDSAPAGQRPGSGTGASRRVESAV
jgi:preprotein translocase subunit SecF